MFVINKDLFIEEGNKPKPGLPTSIARLYRINSLLWNDYRYLEDSHDLELNFPIMLVLFFYSFQ